MFYKNKLSLILFLAAVALFSAADFAFTQDMGLYQVITPDQQARQVLAEEELERTQAEERTVAKLYVAFGGFKNEMIKPRASKVHDRVTFIIEESTDTSVEAKTELESEMDTLWHLQNWFTFDRNDNGDWRVKPYSMLTDDGSINTAQNNENYAQLKMLSEYNHEGEGKTNRKNSFTTKLSGEVIEVLPNGHLVVEAKKSIRINDETQEVKLVGTVDPNDLNENSEVNGERIVNLKIGFSGRGEVTDTIRQGWFAKLANKFKPF